MPRLYELSDEYNALINALDDEEADQENLTAQLNAIKGKFDDKAENIGKLILSLSSDAETLKTEEARLSKRRNTLENRVSRLKEYLKYEMTVAELEKIEGSVLTISLRKNPPSVKILNEDDIPEEYRKVIPETWQPDKNSIIEHFKGTGEIIKGVDIITTNKSLVIR